MLGFLMDYGNGQGITCDLDFGQRLQDIKSLFGTGWDGSSVSLSRFVSILHGIVRSSLVTTH